MAESTDGSRSSSSQPLPAVTIKVCPSGWVCHAVRAPASKLTNAPPTRAGGNYTGTKIDGGTSRHVVPGDVIITPGRTPHLWANIESDMSYLVFRPDPSGTLPLK